MAAKKKPGPGQLEAGAPERFPAKWTPVRVKKTRQNRNLEPRSDSIGTEKALAGRGGASVIRARM